MRAIINPEQGILPGLELAWCKCGCNQSFMRVAKGRRREYINDTHKKREARRLEKLRRTDTRVRLAPMGYLYLHASDNREISALWDAMSATDKAVITALCDTGLTPTELTRALNDLFVMNVF